MSRMVQQSSLRLLLSIVALLLGANLFMQMHGSTTARAVTPTSAVTGIPDSGAQFQAMVDELRGVNRRLDTLETFLEGGNLKVKAKVEPAPDK